MPEKLDLTQKLLCNKIGKMFEMAASRLQCYELSFCKTWLVSDLNKQIIALEESLIYQSKQYLFNSFKQELKVSLQEEYKMDANAMYWLGYLLTYWMFMDDIDGETIIKNYSLKVILEQYDVLHTMSIKAAIKTIKSDYSIESVLLDSVLHSD